MGIFTERNVVTTVASTPLDLDQVAERELEKSLLIMTTPEAVKELSSEALETRTCLTPSCLLPLPKGQCVSDHRATWRARAATRESGVAGRHEDKPGQRMSWPALMGSFLEFQSPAETPLFCMYITGKTLVIDDLKEIPRRYPEIELALLHLGRMRELSIIVTMDGKQGVQVLRMVAPKRVIPIHYNNEQNAGIPVAQDRHIHAMSGRAKGIPLNMAEA